MTKTASLWTIALCMLLACSSAAPGRMSSYLGPELSQPAAFAGEHEGVPPEGFRAALLVINDTTGPDSAPPLSAARWALMENLVREQLEAGLPLRVVAVVPSSATSGALDRARLRALGRRHEVGALVVVVLTSREDEAPTHLGQGYMMTQMPGVTVVNRALMELAWLDARAGRLMLEVQGRGSEILEELDVPLGSGQPDKREARDLLRINAAKHALDRALLNFRKAFARRYVP